MLNCIILMVALVMLIVAVLAIFNARVMVKSKAKVKNENNVVSGLKVVGYALSIVSLILIYYFNK